MSYSFAGHYARLPLGHSASRWLAAEEIEAAQGQDGQYVCVRIEDALGGENDRELLQMLSGEGGAAIYLSVHAEQGWFEYQHWRDGARSRALSFLPGSGWTVAEGEPEEWEAECFFKDREGVDAYLSDLAQRWGEGEALKREQLKLDEIWNLKCIETGLPLPGLREETAADAIARHYDVCLFP